jgi:hypothetical protein
VTTAQAVLDRTTYVALGHFVVAFSGILGSLESSTIQLLGANGRARILIEAALADRTAYPIMSSFFSVFYAYWGEKITPGDKAVLRQLRRELISLIEIRNRLMHDAWMSTTVGGDEGPHPLSRMRVRAHGAGVEYEMEPHSPQDLEQLAADATRLPSCVNGTVWYCRPGQVGPELEQRYTVVSDKLQRVQPRGP